MSQKYKLANEGKSISSDGPPSHISDQEELVCLRPTVENLNKQNKISILKGNTGWASEAELWTENVQAEKLK